MYIEINDIILTLYPFYLFSIARYQRLIHGEGNGAPLQYSCLENPMDGGAWWAAVHGVAKSRTRLRDFTFTLWLLCIECSPPSKLLGANIS